VNIQYRPLDAVQQELAEAIRVRMSGDRKILQHLDCQTEEVSHVTNFLAAHVSGLKGDRLDKVLRILLKSAVKNRGQELALEIERRETMSHALFPLDAEVFAWEHVPTYMVA
jgi:hypothetical protein